MKITWHKLEKFVALIILLSICLPFSSFSISLSSAEQLPDLSVTVQAFDKDRIRQHVEFFSSCGSRVTGYPGFYNASDYIVQKLKEYNITTWTENYDVTIPIDYGCSVSLPNGITLKAYAVWPNDVNPSPYVSPPSGDRLVYVGKGGFEDYNGKNVTGKFVLMDENSRWYFRIAALYGAKGVIYRQEDTTTRQQALQKYYDIPLNFPRLFVKYKDGEELLRLLKDQGEIKIHIKSNVTWVKKTVPNIIGYIPGKGPHANEAVVLCAYYDSWSIIPALSPGATDSLGIATLLELARFFAANPPDRSVIILAVSGHWQGLWGAREWVDSHFNEIGIKIKLFLGMDLSSGTSQVGVYYAGVTYPYLNPESLRRKYSWLIERLFSKYLPSLRSYIGEDYGREFVDHVFLAYPQYIAENYPMDFSNTLLFDSDPFVVASYGGGITFHTTNDIRLYMKTPIDTYEKINFANLWPQVQFILSSAWGLANEPQIPIFLSPVRFGNVDWGFSNLIVKVTIYNMTTAYWDTITKANNPDLWSNIVVHITFPGSAFLPGGLSVPTIAPGGIGAYIDVIAIPNEKGEVIVKGLKPYTTGRVLAYAINKTSGNIEWATDFGTFQAPPFGTATTITARDYTRMVALFPCASIVMLSLYNPLTFQPQGIIAGTGGVTTGGAGFMDPALMMATGGYGGFLIFHHLSHGPMIHQSLIASSLYGDAMAFIEPNTPTEILVPFPGARFPYGLLLNATKDKPDGYGYVLSKGEDLKLTLTPLTLARNLYNLNNGRVSILRQKNAFNPIIEVFHNLAEKHLEEAESALKNKKFNKVYGFSYGSLALEVRAYHATLDLIFQVIQTAIYFFIVLMPFAFLLERMLSPSEGVKRILKIILIFAVSLGVLGFFHPGFYIATNIYMVILSFLILVIILPTIIFIVSAMYGSIRSYKESLLGRHGTRISWTGALSHSFSSSIGFMKRRKFRTLLTGISTTLILFSLISFTSIYLIPRPRTEVRSYTPGQIPEYSVLIRYFPWSPIPEEIYYQIKSQYEGISYVAPRGWFVVPSSTGAWGSLVFSPNLTTTINAFLFVSPNEAEITHLWENIGLKGRGFLDSDIYACMISERAAANLTKELGRPIGLGSKIPLWGMNLTVVGLFNGDFLWSGAEGLLDLDAEPITPMMPIPGVTAQARPPHFKGDVVIILPFKLALHTREFFSFMSLSFKPFNKTVVKDLATNLALRLAMDVYYRLSGDVEIVRYREWFSITGSLNLLIPLLIGCLAILDILLGTVYERTKEITIYMSVGLSPLHVSGIFLTEVSIYAVLSGVIAYICGMAGTWILQLLNMYPPEFYPNYSSVFVLLILGVAEIMILASAAYPLRKVASFVTPSMERKWRIPKPFKGSDVWHVPFPFVAQEREIYGLFAFLKEYLDLHKGERVGSFLMEKLGFEKATKDENELMILKARIRLAPFDQAIVQDVNVVGMRRIGGNRYSFSIDLHRISGVWDIWVSSNKFFLDDIRKQMLIWRSVSPEEKEKYINRGIELLKRSGAI